MTGIPTEYLILFISDSSQHFPTLSIRHKNAGFIIKNGIVPTQFDQYPQLQQNYTIQTDKTMSLLAILNTNLLNTFASAAQDIDLLEVEIEATKFLCYQHKKGEWPIKMESVQKLVRHGIKIYRQI